MSDSQSESFTQSHRLVPLMLMGLSYVSGHVYLVIMNSDLVGLKCSVSLQCWYTEGVYVRQLVIFYIISRRSDCLDCTPSILLNHSKSYWDLPISCSLHVRECVIKNLFCATNIAKDSYSFTHNSPRHTQNWCRLGIVYVFVDCFVKPFQENINFYDERSIMSYS